MRILLIAHGWPLSDFGGLGLYVEAIAQGFAHIGHQISVLTPQIGPTEKPYIQSTGCDWGQHWQLHLPVARNWIDSWAHRSAQPLLQTTLKNLNPDVIHIHHLDGLPLDFWALSPSQAIRAITLHDYAIPCARGQLVNDKAQICAGPSPQNCTPCLGHRLRPHPWLNKLRQWFSHPLLIQAGQKIVQPTQPYRHHLTQVQHRLNTAKRLIHDCDLYLSPSHHLISQMAALNWPQPQYCQLPILKNIPPTPAPEAHPKKIIFSSRIAPSKGLHLLLEAIALLPPQSLSLTIVGQAESSDAWPDYPAHIQKCIHRRQQEGHHIAYLGHQSHDTVLSLLHQHHVFILPSLWPENAPISVREAAAAGLQIICRRDSGAMEMSPSAIGITPSVNEIAKAIQHISTERCPPQCQISVLEHCQTLQSLYRERKG